MAVQIDSDAVADATVTNGIFPPVVSGLTGFWEHLTSLDRARLNLATGQLGTIVGTPTIASDGTIFTGFTNYLDTLMAEVAEQTWITVGRTLDPIANTTVGKCAPLGNYRSSGVGGISLFIQQHSTLPDPAGTLNGNAKFATALVAAATSQTDVSGWRCRTLRVGDNAGTVVNDLTAGVSATTARVELRTMNTSAETMRIGSSSNNSYLGRYKAIYTAAYNRRLSDAELATMRTWLQSMAADVDPTVVF